MYVFDLDSSSLGIKHVNIDAHNMDWEQISPVSKSKIALPDHINYKAT